jgi:protein-L-isoaspartate(D-aspartate) O-methyltransferase
MQGTGSDVDRANPKGEPMSIDTPDIKQARRWFAEELRHTAHVRSLSVVEAFATVPREHFVGPGPWRILSPLGGPDYWTTDDSDPRRLCHDVLVAIDETRRLNNGQPSLWAALFDQLGLAPGARVVHVGAGLGYYSAILAEIVGPSGEVTAIEIDAALAERARANLARSWPQARVIAGDGFGFRAEEPVDAIVVNAGVSHLALPWLDSLKPDGGRLLVPFTNANLWGAFLMVSRQGARYPVRFASRVGIIACAGGRDAEAEARLTAALARADYTAVKSLRRPPDEPDETCWLAGDGWWLSTAPVEEAPRSSAQIWPSSQIIRNKSKANEDK